MADSMEETQGSWWGGWLQSAKEKSLAAVDFVKRDLSEFTTTMTHDTTKIVGVTSSTIKETLKAENTSATKEKVKESFNMLFEGLSKALVIPHDDDDDDDNIRKTQQASEGTTVFDRSKARLRAIQVDPGTYLNEPSGTEHQFKDWLAEFKLDDNKGHISEVLVTNVEVRALYTKLVPLQMSHTQFWERYFYKLHQLEMDELRKQAMMNRAEQEREDSLGWEDDWSGEEEFEDLSNTSITESSETKQSVPKNKPSLPSSSLQPMPERGKDTRSSDLSKEQKPCDNLTCDQEHTNNAQKKDENSASTESLKNRDNRVTETKDHIKKLSSEVQQQIVVSDSQTDKVNSPESSAAETVAPDNQAVHPASSEDLDVSHVEDVNTFSANQAAEEPIENTEAKNTSNNCETLDTEQTSVMKIEEQIPMQTPEAERSSVEIIPETAPSAVARRITDSDILAQSDSVVKSGKDEEAGHASLGDEVDLKTKIKGDMVVVGSDRESPNSDSSGTKDFLHLLPDPSTEEDWEHDFDIEVTEEDLKAADEIAKNLGTNLDLQDDDWENWE